MKKIILSGIALSFAAALNASTALADQRCWRHQR